MSTLQHIIEKHWYKQENFLLSLLLYPISLIFLFISTTRKLLFKLGIFKSYKLPVPVVIIGNITVGGAGKTPLTLKIADELTSAGYKVGIILRGYKSELKTTTVVHKHMSANQVGDEALIYATNNHYVAIGSNRYEAGLTLLKAYPDIQIILSDDGMQHYRLKRDYEIAVIDSTRLLGNQHVLPMGPLREKKQRLKDVNAIIYNGQIDNKLTPKTSKQLIISQKVILDKIINFKNDRIISIDEMNTNNNILALAAIGNPQRFFDFLIHLGIKVNHTESLPDHYDFKNYNLPQNYDAILVTEKDYVKLCTKDNGIIWTIKVSVELSDNLIISEIIKLCTVDEIKRGQHQFKTP